MRLALVAFALFFGAFWYTMPAPRPVFVDCAPPRAAEEIFARASALRTAERLFHDRRLIYGWSTRARLHLDNMRFWFAGRVLGYYGSQASAAYMVGEPSGIPELALIFDLQNALQVPDCAAAELVPDSATDSLPEAEEKLRRILTVLGRPAAP